MGLKQELPCLLLHTCRQLAHIGQLRIEDEEEEEEWIDPSGGVLVNIFAACEEGDTEKLAVNLAELKQTEFSIDTPGVQEAPLQLQQHKCGTASLLRLSGIEINSRCP
jgi:hypothetical protein